MAFFNRVGSILRRSVSHNSASSSLMNSIRCMSSSKLFIGGLSFGTDDHSLKDAFSGFGDVVEGTSSTTAAHVFLKWGCTPSDLSKIFSRQPSLRHSYPAPLESKLSLLSQLGIRSSDLVKIINCRPRFLSSNLTHYFDTRLDDLCSFLGSKDKVAKAIVRNPSLILYDFKTTVQPVVSLYQELGLTKPDFISMLLLRPTLIPRTHMTPEKLDYIQRTGVPKDAKLYKYVVTIMGVSRIETICEKISNFEKFGFSEDEVLLLFGRAPLLMTLSVDKVQRNMTFVVGTMKLPHHSVVDCPYLLFASLEDVLKPRVLLAGKIQDMNLLPQIKGTRLITALRMSEKRFLDAFVNCHEKDVKDELLEFYQTAKGFKRLAESSRKKIVANGFPF